MPRALATPILAAYDDWTRPAPEPCDVFDVAAGGGGPRRAGGLAGEGASSLASSAAATLTVDALSSTSVESFRMRVGMWHGVPFAAHAPDDIPTVDAYFPWRPHAAAADAAGAGAPRLCFPRNYADGCVPKPNRSFVEANMC